MRLFPTPCAVFLRMRLAVVMCFGYFHIRAGYGTWLGNLCTGFGFGYCPFKSVTDRSRPLACSSRTNPDTVASAGSMATMSTTGMVLSSAIDDKVAHAGRNSNGARCSTSWGNPITRVRMRVYKYPLAITDYPSVVLPEGAKILHIGEQNGLAFLWALVDPGFSTDVQHDFRMVGTGHDITDEDAHRFPIHVGSFFMRGGALVFHVFSQTK